MTLPPTTLLSNPFIKKNHSVALSNSNLIKSAGYKWCLGMIVTSSMCHECCVQWDQYSLTLSKLSVVNMNKMEALKTQILPLTVIFHWKSAFWLVERSKLNDNPLYRSYIINRGNIRHLYLLIDANRFEILTICEDSHILHILLFLWTLYMLDLVDY